MKSKGASPLKSSSEKWGESELQRWHIYTHDCLVDGCEIEPIPLSVSQYPVINDPQGQRHWSPVDYKMLMQLKKAVAEGGIMDSTAQLFLDTISMAGPLIFDWRQVARACPGSHL